MEKIQVLVTRRAFLTALLTMPVPLILAACGAPQSAPASPATVTAAPPPNPPTESALPTAAPTEVSAPLPTATQVVQLAPTPACGDADDEPTPAQTEGPYFTPGSPERASLLEPDMRGTKLTVSGSVLSTTCQPVARALLDVWQCDGAGVYDNVGYRLRGHLFADEQGHYQFTTIVPGVYPGRTRHIHVKVQAPNNPVLTTQLYFPGEPRNQQDGIYRPELEMALTDNPDGSQNGAFDFVLQLA